MERLENIPLSKLRRCPIQFGPVCRQTLDYQQMRDSVRDRGLLQTILVRPVGDMYEVVCGNHRYEMCRDLGRETAPCLIREMNDDEVYLVQVIENASRITRRPQDYYVRLQHLIRSRKTTVEDIAAKLSQHPDWVRGILSLNNLSPTAKKSLTEGILSCIIGIELAKLPVKRQDELLPGLSGLKGSEALELVRSEVREHRAGCKAKRAASSEVLTSKPFGVLKNEYLEKPNKALILTRAGLFSEDASKAYDALLEWVVNQDEESIKKDKARRKARQRRPFDS